jgi:hypothetical protein
MYNDIIKAICDRYYSAWGLVGDAHVMGALFSRYLLEALEHPESARGPSEVNQSTDMTDMCSL